MVRLGLTLSFTFLSILSPPSVQALPTSDFARLRSVFLTTLQRNQHLSHMPHSRSPRPGSVDEKAAIRASKSFLETLEGRVSTSPGDMRKAVETKGAFFSSRDGEHEVTQRLCHQMLEHAAYLARVLFLRGSHRRALHTYMRAFHMLLLSDRGQNDTDSATRTLMLERYLIEEIGAMILTPDLRIENPLPTLDDIAKMVSIGLKDSPVSRNIKRGPISRIPVCDRCLHPDAWKCQVALRRLLHVAVSIARLRQMKGNWPSAQELSSLAATAVKDPLAREPFRIQLFSEGPVVASVGVDRRFDDFSLSRDLLLVPFSLLSRRSTLTEYFTECSVRTVRHFDGSRPVTSTEPVPWKDCRGSRAFLTRAMSEIERKHGCAFDTANEALPRLLFSQGDLPALPPCAEGQVDGSGLLYWLEGGWHCRRHPEQGQPVRDLRPKDAREAPALPWWGGFLPEERRSEKASADGPPDLLTESLEIVPKEPKAGKSFDVRFVVWNRGRGRPADASHVSVVIDGPEKRRFVLPVQATGHDVGRMMSQSVTLNEDGDYEILVEPDCHKTVDEVFETNSGAQARFFVDRTYAKGSLSILNWTMTPNLPGHRRTVTFSCELKNRCDVATPPGQILVTLTRSPQKRPERSRHPRRRSFPKTRSFTWTFPNLAPGEEHKVQETVSQGLGDGEARIEISFPDRKRSVPNVEGNFGPISLTFP